MPISETLPADERPFDTVRTALELPTPAWWLREAVAAAAWIYIVLNALVIDVDGAVSRLIPLAEYLLPYKGLAVLAVVAGVWVSAGHRRFGLTVGYVAAYPLVVLLWKVPKWAILNWSLTIAFLPAAYALSKGFRRTFVLTVGAALAVAVVLRASTDVVVWSGISYLLLYLAVHYGRRFVGAFSRSTVFSAALRGIRGLRDHVGVRGFLAPKTKADGTEEDPMSRALSGYLFISGLRIAAEKLREVSASRRGDIYLISSLVFTLALTTGLFGVLFLGLARMDPSNFQSPDGFGFWTAMGYSFSTLIPADFDLMGVTPQTAPARALSLAESACSLLLLLLLVFVRLTSIRERYRADLNEVVDELGEASRMAGRSLEAEFQTSIAELEMHFAQTSPEMMTWLASHDPDLRRLRSALPPEPTDAPHPNAS